MRIEAAPFPEHGGVSADFVTCQHVLEHVADPAALLRDIRVALEAGDRPATCYVEVPDGAYMLEHAAVWDVIYEHAPTSRRRRCGDCPRPLGSK